MPEADADLGRRLAVALDDVRSGEVDTVRLVAGARAGARRLRRRRAVVACSAAAVAVAAPIGVVALTSGDAPPDRTEVADQPVELRTPAPAPLPAEPVPEAPDVDPLTLPPGENATRIPSAAGLSPTDLPVPVDVQVDEPQRPLPAVNGLQCDFQAEAAQPTAGRFQAFAEAGSDAPQQLAVYATVTVWPRAAGPEAFAVARDGGGGCTYGEQVEVVGVAPSTGQQAFVIDGFLEGSAAGTAVVRVGDVLVGVQASGPVGSRDYVALAQSLSEAMAARVVAERVAGSAAP